MIKPDIVSALDADRLLVLLPGYCAPGLGERFVDGSAIANAFVGQLGSWRGANKAHHVRVHRDFYANPRTAAYMAAAAGELIGRSRIGSAVALVDLSIALSEVPMPWAGHCRAPAGRLRDLASGNAEVASCDAVLLLHSDPLGMGLGRLENMLLQRHPSRVFVLNGRRRAYRLNAPFSRVLRRRRVLAETRIVESALATLVRPVGSTLALLDRLGVRRT